MPDQNDTLTRGYDTILTEVAVLTIFSAFIFGFLLNVSINSHHKFEVLDNITVVVALCSITTAALLFVMPAIYHHLQFPYQDIDKFKARAHRFILLGLIPAGLTLYLGVALALHSVIPSPESFILALPPFILAYFLFRARKRI